MCLLLSGTFVLFLFSIFAYRRFLYEKRTFQKKFYLSSTISLCMQIYHPWALFYIFQRCCLSSTPPLMHLAWVRYILSWRNCPIVALSLSWKADGMEWSLYIVDSCKPRCSLPSVDFFGTFTMTGIECDKMVSLFIYVLLIIPHLCLFLGASKALRSAVISFTVPSVK